MDASSAIRLIDLTRRTAPGAVRLAELASLAAQIEPELLRALRVELLPGVEAGAEADLWFSPLAQSSTPERVWLRPDVLAALRAALLKPDHPIGLAAAWRVQRRVHRTTSAATRLEEQLTCLALIAERRTPPWQARTIQAIDRLLRRVVVEMSQSEEQGRRLARWATSVLPRLPVAAQQTDSFTLVTIAASLLLDGRSIGPMADTVTANLEQLALVLPPDLKPMAVPVRLVTNGLEIGNLADPDGQTIDLPKTSPLFAQVTWQMQDGLHSRLLSWPPDEFRSLVAPVTEFQIRTAIGDVYTLRALQPQPQPEPLSADSTANGNASWDEPLPTGEEPLTKGALNFELRLERGRGGYVARVISSPVGTAQITLKVDAEALVDLQKRWQGQPPLSPRDAQEYGRRLFETVFNGEGAAIYRSSAKAAADQSMALRLMLQFDESSDVSALPWELLFDQETKNFLALSSQTPIVRQTVLPTHGTKPRIEWPLRVLVMTQLSPDAEREWPIIERALTDPAIQGRIAIDRLPRAVLRELSAQLLYRSYPVVMFAGQTGYDSATGQPALWFEDDGQPRPVGLKELAAALRDDKALQLLLIMADSPRDAPLRAVTQPPLVGDVLIRNGVPTVLAWTAASRDETRGTFLREFFVSLVDGLPLEAALTEARVAMYARREANVDWAAPRLHTRSANDLMFEWAPREADRPQPRIDPKVPPLESRVLVIEYDPIIGEGTGRRLSTLSELVNWQPVGDLISGFSADLAECSGQQVRYRAVEHIKTDRFPVMGDGQRMSGAWYTELLRNAGKLQPKQLNYAAVLDEFKVLDRIEKDEIDEVWIFAPRSFGLYESIMAGTGAFFCNAPPLTDVSGRRFVIMGFNVERGMGEMLESFGQRAEAILTKVFERTSGDKNLFARFTRYDKLLPGKAEVGTLHFAPNSEQDYDWKNMRLVPSTCDDWYNFPEFEGRVRDVNAAEWGGGDIRLHHQWWFRHLPRVSGARDGISNNWWEYVVDPERAGRRPGDVPKRPRPARSGPAADSGGQINRPQTRTVDSSTVGGDVIKGNKSNQTQVKATTQSLEVQAEIEGQSPTAALRVGQTYRLAISVLFLDTGQATETGGVGSALRRLFRPSPQITATIQLDAEDFSRGQNLGEMQLRLSPGETERILFEIVPRRSGELTIEVQVSAQTVQLQHRQVLRFEAIDPRKQSSAA